jgi:hypothetical protein
VVEVIQDVEVIEETANLAYLTLITSTSWITSTSF